MSPAPARESRRTSDVAVRGTRSGLDAHDRDRPLLAARPSAAPAAQRRGRRSVTPGSPARAPADHARRHVTHPVRQDDVAMRPQPVRLRMERELARGRRQLDAGRSGRSASTSSSRSSTSPTADRVEARQRRPRRPSATDQRSTRPSARSGPAGSPEPGRRSLDQEPAALAALPAPPSCRQALGRPARRRLDLAGERRRHPAADPDVALAVLELDRAALADAREQLAVRVRQRHVDVRPRGSRARSASSVRRASMPKPVSRADRHRAADDRRTPLPSPAAAASVSRSALLSATTPRLVAGAELVEHRLDRRPVLGRVGGRRRRRPRSAHPRG